MNRNAWLFGCGGLILAAVVLAVGLGGWAMSVNNNLVALQEQMKSSWAQVETVLQRRYDLIPNLVATVKGYAEHEKELFENVARLRSQWSAAQTLPEKTKAAGEMEGALARLLVVAENYPDLKANQNFRDLQFELSGTENRISVERRLLRCSSRGERCTEGSILIEPRLDDENKIHETREHAHAALYSKGGVGPDGRVHCVPARRTQSWCAAARGKRRCQQGEGQLAGAEVPAGIAWRSLRRDRYD